MAHESLDAIDALLIRLLQEDNRQSYVALGHAVGLSVSGVNARLKRLASLGVVSGGTATIDPNVVGLSLLAFIEVVLDRPEHDVSFMEHVREIPSILECHHTTGAYSYLLKVRVRDTAALEQLISHELKQIAGVGKTFTTIVLSSPKETRFLDVTAGPISPK